MRRLVLVAPLGGLLFTIAWLILGAVSPGYTLFGNVIEPYSWVSQPVSGLGLGVTGPWMNAAFIVGGILILVGQLSTIADWWGRGLLARAAFILMASMGIGMIVCGTFTLESMMVHLSGFLLAVPLPAIGLILAYVVLRREASVLARIALVGGIASLALFVLFMATFDATGAGGNDGYSGLIQRALILVTMTSVLIVAMGAPRRDRAAAAVTALPVTSRAR